MRCRVLGFAMHGRSCGGRPPFDARVAPCATLALWLAAFSRAIFVAAGCRLTPEPSCQPCCFRLVFRRPASRRETSSHSAIVVGRRPRQASCRRGGHHTSMYVCAEALPCVFHRGLHTRARARVSGGARVRNVEGGTRGGKRSSDHGSNDSRSEQRSFPSPSLASHVA